LDRLGGPPSQSGCEGKREISHYTESEIVLLYILFNSSNREMFLVSSGLWYQYVGTAKKKPIVFVWWTVVRTQNLACQNCLKKVYLNG
jgi:hypothetical protein